MAANPPSEKTAASAGCLSLDRARGATLASVATHLDRRNAGALAIGTLLAAAAMGLAFCDPPRTADHDEESARAMIMHTPERAWPPVAGNLDVELAATAIQRLSELSAYDAGLDAGALDAGPPIALPEGELDGVQARLGLVDGIHFLEVVLGEATLDDPLPIVFVLHGRGSSAQLPGGPFLGLSRPVRVIVPQAPERLGRGWQWLPVSVGSGLVDRLASSLFQVASRLARVIRTIVAERPTKGKPIVTGFSQGGMIAYALALHHDDVVGYAFALSTWLPPPLEPLYRREDLRYPPIRAMHGENDSVIPVEPTRALVQRLRERGFDVELRTFSGVGHEMSAEMDALLHLWLERAICETVGDDACPAASPVQPAPDAGEPEPDEMQTVTGAEPPG